MPLLSVQLVEGLNDPPPVGLSDKNTVPVGVLLPFSVSSTVIVQAVWNEPEDGITPDVGAQVSVVLVTRPCPEGAGVGVGWENGVAVGSGVRPTNVGGGVGGNVPKLAGVGAAVCPTEVK